MPRLLRNRMFHQAHPILRVAKAVYSICVHRTVRLSYCYVAR